MKPRRIEPGPGQESVWDYPRPPRVEPTAKHIQIIFNGVRIVDSQRAVRVLETSHPPTYYIPREDILMEHLAPVKRMSLCEWKGAARYYTVRVDGKEAPEAAWTYPEPTVPFEVIRDHFAFYPDRMGVCLVDGEIVQAQAGSFYGGWITKDVVGPFKGESGTHWW